MKAYQATTAVWQTGSGWQPHDIADQDADTLDDAREIAKKIIANGAQLGQPIVTISQGENEIETLGWEEAIS